MSYATKENVLEVSKVKVLDRVLSASFTTDPIETRNLFSGAIWLDWSDATAVDATAIVQEAPTVDGPWRDRPGAAEMIDSPEESKKISIDDVDAPYVRVVVTKNSETAAKVTLRYYFKGAR